MQLLIGLNSATSPAAVSDVYKLPNVLTRFLTRRFHAKIFLSDDAALPRGGPDPDTEIEKAVGRAEPVNADVTSRTQSRQRLFLQQLQREVNEEYRPHFSEVTKLLRTRGFRRQELTETSVEHETNRFLNWLRLTLAPGDHWKESPLRTSAEREPLILKYGQQWTMTADNRIPDDYLPLLETVQRTFGTRTALAHASKDDLMAGLLGLHAFMLSLSSSDSPKGVRSTFRRSFGPAIPIWAGSAQHSHTGCTVRVISLSDCTMSFTTRSAS